jgi:hypothetical protein
MDIISRWNCRKSLEIENPGQRIASARFHSISWGIEIGPKIRTTGLLTLYLPPEWLPVRVFINYRDRATPLYFVSWQELAVEKPKSYNNSPKKNSGYGKKTGAGICMLSEKTGTGKSTLLANMLISDIRDGRWVALIDPHGDPAEHVLDFVPKERIDDVVYFNPGDLEYPITFNPLEKASPCSHHLVTSGLISVFKKIWPEFWDQDSSTYSGTRSLHFYPGATLLDLPRLPTNKDFRCFVLKRVTNQQIREFWCCEFEKYSAYMKSEEYPRFMCASLPEARTNAKAPSLFPRVGLFTFFIASSRKADPLSQSPDERW